MAHSTDATVSNCENSRNAYYGVLIEESTNIAVTKSLIEANDRSGVISEFLHKVGRVKVKPDRWQDYYFGDVDKLTD